MPELNEFMIFYFESFLELCSCRIYLSDGSYGPIPFTAIKDYLDEKREHDPDWRSIFSDIIRKVDEEYMRVMGIKAEKEREIRDGKNQDRGRVERSPKKGRIPHKGVR